MSTKKQIQLVFILLFFKIINPHGFAGDTLVQGEDGKGWYINHVVQLIENKQKIYVLSYDEPKKEWVSKKVKYAGFSQTDYYCRLGFNSDSQRFVQCTPLQLFYRISDQAWIAAYKLQIGDKLLCANNKTVTVSDLEIINQKIDVYTLEIKNTHIFLVTKDKIVAHNMLIPGACAATVFAIPAEIGCGATVGSVLGPVGVCAGVAIGAILGSIVHACIKEHLIQYGLCYSSKETRSFENISKKEVQENNVQEIKPAKSVEDILKDAVLGEKTKGRTKQYVKSGGYKAAVKDFEDSKPTNVKSLPDREGKVGTLPDGRTIVVRESSKEGRPTLEIQRFSDTGKIIKIIKIRYEDKKS